MLKNYLLLTLRTIRRHKGHAAINILGLASSVAEQRTKEIGLRKTLGASLPSVLVLLSKDFSKWVLLANVFAWPVAWIGMNRWLDTFAYRTEFGVWTLFSGAAIAFAIAVLTVSYKSAKAASANPIASLRYE